MVATFLRMTKTVASLLNLIIRPVYHELLNKSTDVAHIRLVDAYRGAGPRSARVPWTCSLPRKNLPHGGSMLRSP